MTFGHPSASQSAYGKVPYQIDWTLWLAGETILSSSIEVEQPLVLQSTTYTTKLVIAWIDSNNCKVGDVLNVKNSIVTHTGIEESKSFKIAIVE